MPRGRPRKILESDYHAILHLAGKAYFSQGKTAMEAIERLTPDIVPLHGVLVLKHGDKSKERILNRRIMRGLFFKGSALIREVAIKNVSLLFDI